MIWICSMSYVTWVPPGVTPEIRTMTPQTSTQKVLFSQCYEPLLPGSLFLIFAFSLYLLFPHASSSKARLAVCCWSQSPLLSITLLPGGWWVFHILNIFISFSYSKHLCQDVSSFSMGEVKMVFWIQFSLFACLLTFKTKKNNDKQNFIFVLFCFAWEFDCIFGGFSPSLFPSLALPLFPFSPCTPASCHELNAEFCTCKTNALPLNFTPVPWQKFCCLMTRLVIHLLNLKGFRLKNIYWTLLYLFSCFPHFCFGPTLHTEELFLALTQKLFLWGLKD